jgi:hypothetical protein
MLIAVQTNRGPSPIYVEVQTNDEDKARRAAYNLAYGDAEESPAIDDYTSVVRPVATIAG